MDALVPTIIDDDALNRSVFREGDRRENEAPYIFILHYNQPIIDPTALRGAHT